MLPRTLLQFRREDDRVRPTWLQTRHDPWLRTVIESFRACEGIPFGELERRGDVALEGARALGLADTAARGVWHVLRRWISTIVDAPTPPRKLRDEVFTTAITQPESVVDIARRFDGGIEQLRRWLYADLPAARIVRPKELPQECELRDFYNMSLAQGLLGRCTRITVSAPENLRVVVRSAKLRGLLVAVDAEGPKLHASGPLALFRHTTKYANALALFLPALVTMPSWTVEGDALLTDSIERLCIDSTSPLPRTWTLPQRTDSGLEERLMHGLKKHDSQWRVKREAVVLRVGRELFFPDFLLERGKDRVLVEVVGFWTPDYLERKVAQLATVTNWPLVVCVDETLACDVSRLSNADIVRFRRHLDPLALIAAAERAIHSHRARHAG